MSHILLLGASNWSCNSARIMSESATERHSGSGPDATASERALQGIRQILQDGLPAYAAVLLHDDQSLKLAVQQLRKDAEYHKHERLLLEQVTAALDESNTASTPQPAWQQQQGPRASFLCPITCEVMLDPVFTVAGHTYDRTSIENWLATKNTDPVTGSVLDSKKLFPNFNLRSEIQEWQGRQGCTGAGGALQVSARPAVNETSVQAGAVCMPSMAASLLGPSAASFTAQVTASQAGPSVGLTAIMEKLQLKGHTDAVCCVAISPDGRTVVSGGGAVLFGAGDTSVRVWDLVSGQQKFKLKGHTNQVTSVAISPDGETLVSGSSDKTVRVWSLVSGQERLKLKGHKNAVCCVAISPDGKTIVSGGGGVLGDQSIHVWDMLTGQQKSMLHGHTLGFCSVAISPDGNTIVSGSRDMTVRVWDMLTGQQNKGVLLGHTNWVTGVAISPDGKTIVSVSSDKTIRMWDMDSGRKMCMLEGHTSPVISVAISPDGKTIFSGSYDNTVRIWDLLSGNENLKLEGRTGPVISVAISPDGKTIVSGGFDRTVRVWA